MDLASLLANVTLIPIPMFFSEQQIKHVLNIANIDMLIGNWQGFTTATATAKNITHLPSYKLEKKTTGFTLFPNTAKITFTSGSTGSPKGVCLSAEHLQKVTQSLISTFHDDKPQQHLVLLPLSTLLENMTGY